MADRVTLRRLADAMARPRSLVERLIADGNFEPSEQVVAGQTRYFDLHDVCRLTLLRAIIDAGHSATIGRGLTNLKGSIEGERWVVIKENLTNLRKLETGLGKQGTAKRPWKESDLGHPFTIEFATDEALLQAIQRAVEGAHPLTLVADFDEILRAAEETFQRALARQDGVED